MGRKKTFRIVLIKKEIFNDPASPGYSDDSLAPVQEREIEEQKLLVSATAGES